MSEPPTKREAVLDAATRCFSRFGYKRTSMEAIAEAAGVSRPALYQHFAGRADVFRAVVVRLLDAALVDARAAAATPAPLARRLEAVLGVKLELGSGELASSPFRSEFLVEAAAQTRELLVDFDRRFVAVLQGLLEAPELDPSLAGVTSHEAAALLFDGVRGIEADGGPPAGRHTRASHLVRITLRGLAAEKKPRRKSPAR